MITCAKFKLLGIFLTFLNKKFPFLQLCRHLPLRRRRRFWVVAFVFNKIRVPRPAYPLFSYTYELLVAWYGALAEVGP